MSTSAINLVRGWPSPSLLPTTILQRAASRVLTNPNIAHPALLYGPDPGYGPLRCALGKWLTTFFQPHSGAISHLRIAITGGASQSLGNILSVYTDPVYTRKIWIVTPAYFLSFRIFEDAGFGNSDAHEKMAAIPEDDEGLIVEYLRKQMEESEKTAQKEGNNEPVGYPSLMAMRFARESRCSFFE